MCIARASSTACVGRLALSIGCSVGRLALSTVCAATFSIASRPVVARGGVSCLPLLSLCYSLSPKARPWPDGLPCRMSFLFEQWVVVGPMHHHALVLLCVAHVAGTCYQRYHGAHKPPFSRFPGSTAFVALCMRVGRGKRHPRPSCCARATVPGAGKEPCTGKRG